MKTSEAPGCYALIDFGITRGRPTAACLSPARLLILAGLALAAFALRTWWLDRQSFWLDEGFSAALSVGTPRWILGGLPYLPAREPNPPFYYALLYVWQLASGDSEFGLRFLSVIPSVLLVPLLAKVGWRVAGWQVGWLAAALATVNPFLVWLAQEVRMYSWAVFWIALGGWFLIRANQGEGRWNWVGFAAANLLAVYSHIYAGFVVAAEAFYLASRRRWWLPGGAALGAVVGLFVVWFVPVVLTPGETETWRGAIDVPDMLRVLSLTFASQGHLPDAMDSWFGLLVSLLAIIGIGAALASRKRAALLWVVWLSIPLALVYGLSYKVPLFSPRYFIVIVPAYLLLAALGLGRLPRLIGVLGLTVVAGISVWAVERGNTVPSYAKEDFRLAGSYVGARTTANDAVLLVANYIVYAFDQYFHAPGHVLPLDVTPDSSPDTLLAPLASQYDHLWLVEAHDVFADPQDNVGKWLRARYPVADEKYIIGIHFIEFDPHPTLAALPAGAQAIDAQFADGPRLAGYSLQPGSMEHVTLYWASTPAADKDYHLSLKLWGPNGELGGQQDGEPLNAGLPFTKFPKDGSLVRDEHFLSAPPGTYDLRMSVYPPGGSDLQLSGSQDTQLDLGSVALASK